MRDIESAVKYSRLGIMGIIAYTVMLVVKGTANV